METVQKELGPYNGIRLTMRTCRAGQEFHLTIMYKISILDPLFMCKYY